MSITDNVIYGSYGDEKVISATKVLSLGTKMVLPDGRIYRYSKAGGTTLAAGKLVQQEDTVDDHDTDRICSAAAVGDTSITLTLGGSTAVTEDQYAEGYLTITDDTGEGHVYKVKSNNSAATVETCEFTLEPGDAVRVAVDAATTTAGLRTNEFSGLLLWEASTIVGPIAGIPPTTVTASNYFWVHRRGAVAAWVDGSHVLGTGVVASSTVDGTLNVYTASSALTWYDSDIIGYTMSVSGSTEYGLVYLTLE